MTDLIKIFATLCILTIAQALPLSAQTEEVQECAQNKVMTAVQKYNDGDLEAAAALLGEVLSENPEDDAACYYLALTFLAEGDLERAEVYLRKAAELDPVNFWYRYRLARLYAMTSRQELTIDMYEKLLEDFPKKSDLYYDLVDLYSSQGENEKALAMADEIETVFGTTEAIAVFRFNLLQRMGRGEEAYRTLEEYNEKYSSPYVLSTLADHYLGMYNDSTALSLYDEALDLAPDYVPAILGKAETYRITRRYEDYFPVVNGFARNSEVPVEAKADYLSAVIQRSDMKFLRMFRPQMDTLVNAALECHPLDTNILRLSGSYYYSTGRNELAKKHFLAQTDAYPDNITAWAQYVELLMYTDDWKALSKAGREAFAIFPEETAFIEMASVGDYNLGDYKSVMQACETVLDASPRDSSKVLRAWSTIGDIHYQLGNPKKAFKAYEKALKINPDYAYVLNNYAYYLSQQGRKLKKALAMSQKTIIADSDNATYLDTFGWILYLRSDLHKAKTVFKQAMLYGGKDSAVMLDHYAEVLYALKEYDLAFVYWGYALDKNNGDIPDLEKKIEQRKESIRK